ncbi:MAG TPA: oligosaccharide flippase family protein [Lysobacter sp.]|nr:oligosaccharide flippase family protein [Lysobacter sp.]
MTVERYSAGAAALEQVGWSRLLPRGFRRAVATLSLLSGASAIGAFMVFLTQTLLARILGPQEYGLFASSLATVTMLAPLAGFGLAQFRTKVYGAEGWGAHRWLRASLQFSALTTALALALLLLWALLIAPADDTRTLLMVMSPVVLGILAIELICNKLRLEERFTEMALWLLVTPAARLAVALALLAWPYREGRMVAVAYGGIAVLLAVATLPQLTAMARGRMDLKGHGPRPEAMAPAPAPGMRELWFQAWPFGVFAALYPVFYQLNTILLKYISGDAHAGRYSLALAVLTAVYLIPTNVYPKFLQPMLHRWVVHDRPKFWRVHRQAAVGMLGLGLAVGVSVAVASPWVVPIVFGPQYASVAGILAILSVCIPVRFLATAIGAALLTDTYARFRVHAIAAATVATVAMSALLIPRLAEAGAAWAAVFGESVFLLGTLWGVRRFRRDDRANGAVPGAPADSTDSDR